MYIENAYLGKSPKWLYAILLFLFLLMQAFSILLTLLIDFDTDTFYEAQIAKKGELLFLAENLIVFFVFLVILFLWVRFVHQQPLRAFTTSRKKIDWKRFFFSFFIWGGITISFILIDYVINPQNYVLNFEFKSFLFLFLISTLLIPFQAGFEEYFFRGYLMQGIGIFVKNRWFPLLFSSIAFGLMHIANPEIDKLGYSLLIYYIGTGFFLGIITLMDEGLELALGFHIANNLFSALLITSDWGVFQTPSIFRDISEPSLYENILYPLLVFFPLLILIMAKKYKWSNWKEKLFGKVLPEAVFFQSIKQENNQ